MSLPDPLTATMGLKSRRIAVTFPDSGGAAVTLLSLLIAAGYVPPTTGGGATPNDGGIIGYTLHSQQPSSGTARAAVDLADSNAAMTGNAQRILSGVAYTSWAANEAATVFVRSAATPEPVMVVLALLP